MKGGKREERKRKTKLTVNEEKENKTKAVKTEDEEENFRKA